MQEFQPLMGEVGTGLSSVSLSCTTELPFCLACGLDPRAVIPWLGLGKHEYPSGARVKMSRFILPELSGHTWGVVSSLRVTIKQEQTPPLTGICSEERRQEVEMWPICSVGKS